MLNSDRAERAIEDALQVLETLKEFYKKTAPYAHNEITIVNEKIS